MINKRIIPVLLISGEDLVKTIKYKNPSYVGDPINTIKIYNEKKIDELIIIDINSSKKNTNINYSLLEKIAGECFMPLTYGGGIKNIEDADKLFSLGIEKISINHSILNDYSLIHKISSKYGSSSVIANVNINQDIFGKYRIYDYIKKKNLKYKINQHINNCIRSGAGEIFINLVFNDGCLNGIDDKFLLKFDNKFAVPIIINGGINSVSNIEKVLKYNYQAVGIGSFFVYYGPHKAVLITYLNNKEYELVQQIETDI